MAFGTKCQHALLNYMEHFRVENAEDAVDTFFLSKDGNSLKPDGFRSLVNRLSKAAGVSRLHAHLMRHTYATRFLLNGGNVFLLQMNLGHTSLAMVRRYVHIASRMAALFSQEFSPLDRVGTWGVECLDHCLNGDGWQGQIFSNAGKATQLSAVPQVGRRSGACGSTGVSLEERILPGSATA